MDSPSASLFPPLALTYIPCCYSPSSFLRPVLLPLMPRLMFLALPLITNSTTTLAFAASSSFLPLYLSPTPHHHQHNHIAAVSSLLNNYLLPTQPLSPPYVSQISIVFSIIELQPKSYHHGFIYLRIRVPDDQGSLRGRPHSTSACTATHHTTHYVTCQRFCQLILRFCTNKL